MEEMYKEIKHFLEWNENEGIPYTILWDPIKAVVRGKVSGSIKILEGAHTSSLTAHLKTLDQKEANSMKNIRE